MAASSRPRTHRGTDTTSVWTFSRPSSFIVWTDHWMARDRFGEPLRRAPNVSVKSARRRHAKSSPVAALIRRSAPTRSGVTNEWVLWAPSDATAATAHASATRPDDRDRMCHYFSLGGWRQWMVDCG